ncbi:hypothetical protein GWN42_29910 [candidate division KSB1 bacterium]|nr:hypothetical protein [candidate division KSB1 bacterium]NIS23612.1 hypothetical protein [candidate division KSB1 bacterium]NIU24245.1 hypothetical protein [candidate division KSB1 bacterium]NIU93814.1 hypothetical protein [candidate division KSB1 bacterium]NIV96891.1 hypothetical protein [candidate division KSB1 bacterium]
MFLHLHLTMFALVWLFGHSEIVSGQERRIKPGDAIDIMVLGHDELSQTVVVSSDGTLNYPLLAEVPVGGITLQKLQDVLVAQFSRVMEPSPVVVVHFAESYPIKVTVLGQVARPGTYEVPNTIAFQAALAQAGISSPGAQLSQVKLIRKNDDEANVQVVNLEKFHFEGDLSYLPSLKDGDIITVPAFPLAKTVKVLGAVTKPGSYELSHRASLLDVIFLAGGPTDRAKMNDIKVTYSDADNRHARHFDLNRFLKQESEDIPMVEPGAVIYVPEQTMTWKTIVALVRDLTVFATLIVLLQRER